MKLKRKVMALLAAGTGIVFATGPCQLEEWRLAVGPVFNGGTMYGGVELEFDNGIDFIIPVAPLGDNLPGGWLGR